MGRRQLAGALAALLSACDQGATAPADATPATDIPAADAVTVDVPAPDVVTVDVPDVVDTPAADVVTADVSAPDVADVPAPDVALANGCPVLSAPVAAAGEDAGTDTWTGFARGFFAQWCTRCHSAAITDPFARNGAPTGLDWDVESIVRANLPRIRQQVGVLNTMPPSAPLPACDERLRIVRWIDRGAP